MTTRRLAWAAVFVLVLAGGPGHSGQETVANGEAVDPIAALTEGNRLFRNGQIEAAAEAYRAGWAPEVSHPTLFYNLGTAYHHLGRLPEAVLWYRRAGASEDPWLEENLQMARSRLGTWEVRPEGLAGVLARRGVVFRSSAIVLAVAAFVVALAGSRLPIWALGVLLLSGVTLYGSAAAVERWGPRPAVLLADCETEAGELPAGTEAWVRRLDDGTFRVEGAGVVCPGEGVELIFPSR
jgi:hypothetical protein